jgi:hypothetical protein
MSVTNPHEGIQDRQHTTLLQPYGGLRAERLDVRCGNLRLTGARFR